MTLRALIVEDSTSDAKLVVNTLRRMDSDVVFARVEEAATMREALQREWDVVLSDWSMPRFTGLDALALVREVAPEIPFIIVSGTVGEEVAVEAMRGGAADYVLKDRLSRLPRAVERALRERAELMARRRAEEALAAVEGRFTRLSEAGIIGVIVADLDGDILEANDAYLGMIGYTRADLEAGISWRVLLPPEAQPNAEQALTRLATTYLPRANGGAVETAPETAPESVRGTETVLLVEDEDQLRVVARDVLRRHGYRVLEARNGGEALLLCERHHGTIALLLTDVVMPHMSGPELAARLAPMRSTMKVLCMSGYTDDSVVRHGVLEADIPYLQKPFTPSSLARRVRQILDA